MTRLTSLTLAVLTATMIIAPPPIDARAVASAWITTTEDDIPASTILPIGEEVQLEQPVVISYIYTITAGGTSEQRKLTVLFGPYPDGGGPAIGTLNMVGVGQLDMTQGFAYVIDEPVGGNGEAESKVGGGTRPTIQTPRTITTSDSTRYIVHITTDVDRVYIIEGSSKVTKRRATSNQVVTPCPAAGKYIEVDNAGTHQVIDTPANSAFIEHVKQVAAKFDIEAP